MADKKKKTPVKDEELENISGGMYKIPGGGGGSVGSGGFGPKDPDPPDPAPGPVGLEKDEPKETLN